MITARQYEDKMKEIAMEYQEKPETRERLMIKAMMDALDCQGYSAGNEVYKGVKDAVEQK